MGSTLPCGEATPMEETVQALMDTLVSPLLPKFSSNRNPPAESLEQSVAKQMHAVVLLYNYFHRKKFPEVEFFNCLPFVKAAVIAKKMLLSFSFVNCGQAGQQTITEKMITEAFDICNGLNAQTSLPRKDSWPVSKVSVLLVDTAKQNFLLQFGSVIHGVWSLIEKDITPAATQASEQNNLERQMTPAKKIFRGTPQSKQASGLITVDEEALLQVAHSAVNDKTGLDSSSLVVLQRDYVDSLSKVRSTTRFYLMQCLKEAGDHLQKVPIKDVLNSLQSPIVAKVSDGYETTDAVTFFQIFPYKNIILNWICRENLQSAVGLENMTTLMDGNVQSVTCPDNSSSGLKGDIPVNVSQLSDDDSKRLNGTENLAVDENGHGKNKRHVLMDRKVQSVTFPENSSSSLKGDRPFNVSQLSDEDSKRFSSAQNLAAEENGHEINNQCALMDVKVQSVTSPDNSSSSLKGDRPFNLSQLSDDDSKRLNSTENHAANEGCRGKKRRRGSKTKKVQVDCNVENLNSPENISSDNLKENRLLNETIQSHEISNTVNCSSDPTAIGSDCGKGVTPDGLDVPSKDSEVSALLGSREVPFVNDSFVVAEAQVVRPCSKQLEPLHNIGDTSNSSENVTGNEFEDQTKKGNNLTMTLASKEHALLQTAVEVLHKKHAKLVHEHQQLSLKQRQVQDAIFLCEKQIQTVMTGGDEASTLVIETVIDGCEVAPLEEETLESCPNLGSASMIRTKKKLLDSSSEKEYEVKRNKRKRLSEAILSLHSPSQELDEICMKNNWLLPTYTVVPSKGGFVASVTVHCLDFNCSGDGNVRCKPQEARESAATCMLNKLRDMAQSPHV